MAAFTTVTRSLAHHCSTRSSPKMLNLLISRNGDCGNQYLSHRTLILDSLQSESVKLRRLSDADSGILEVSLDRPEAKNAIGKELLNGFKHVLERIDADNSANVVMICSSVPKVFCAGADLKERRKMTATEVQHFVNDLRSTFTSLEALRIPSIAVIEGAALGGGLEMALSCDLRVCGSLFNDYVHNASAHDSLLGLPETGLAIIPGAGGTRRLPRVVGRSVAKELIYTGRRITGKEALPIGLVNYSVPTSEVRLKALEIAREINQKGPIAIRMAKRAIDEGMEIDPGSRVRLEEECYEQTLHTKDRLEGLAAFAEKRKPVYKGE